MKKSKVTIDEYQEQKKSVLSQKQRKQNIRQILEDIGIQSSVKQYSNNYYVQLRKILLAHPSAEKRQRIEVSNDLEIYKFGNVFHVNMVFTDGSKESVSWNKCAIGKDDTNEIRLTNAMRNAIYPQIEKFKISHPHKLCDNCNTELGSFHVDHHKPLFTELKKEFIKTHNIDTPTTFEKDGYYTCISDGKFKNLWENYHQKHATLRWLCASCNLSRKLS